MTPDEYQKAAIRTEASIDRETLNQRASAQLVPLLQIMAELGVAVDGHKRVIFYNKPPKIAHVLTMLKIKATVAEAPLFAHSTEEPIEIDPRRLHAVLGLITESGELAKAVLKEANPENGEAFDPTNIVEEAGDFLWYLAILLDSVGVTMENAMERNVAKLRARYGEKFDAEKAVERDLAKEALRGATGGQNLPTAQLTCWACGMPLPCTCANWAVSLVFSENEREKQ